MISILLIDILFYLVFIDLIKNSTSSQTPEEIFAF